MRNPIPRAGAGRAYPTPHGDRASARARAEGDTRARRARASSAAAQKDELGEATDVYLTEPLDPALAIGGRRLRSILASIARDVDAGGTARVRQILASPRELYRIEVERADMAYQRTTVMGREALTLLLEEMPQRLLEERFVFRAAS